MIRSTAKHPDHMVRRRNRFPFPTSRERERLGEVIEMRFHNNLTACAEAIGVSENTLRRFMNPKVKSFRQSSLDLIRRFLPAEGVMLVAADGEHVATPQEGPVDGREEVFELPDDLDAAIEEGEAVVRAFNSGYEAAMGKVREHTLIQMLGCIDLLRAGLGGLAETIRRDILDLTTRPAGRTTTEEQAS